MFKFLSYESISVINTYLQDVTLEKQNWQDLVIQRFGGAVKNALHFLQPVFCYSAIALRAVVSGVFATVTG